MPEVGAICVTTSGATLVLIDLCAARGNSQTGAASERLPVERSLPERSESSSVLVRSMYAQNLWEAGLRDLHHWNLALLFKLLWAITLKKYKFWIRSIHNVYLKDDEVWEIQPKLEDSLFWKVVLRYAYLEQLGCEIGWAHMVWKPCMVLCHRMMLWLLGLDRIRLQTKLCKCGVCDVDMCGLCGQSSETRDHVFLLLSFLLDSDREGADADEAHK
ncbi:hypothetical protein Ancab_039096 [Ancistrocladus abbreviatus]